MLPLVKQFVRILRLPVVAVLFCCCALVGCALFPSSSKITTTTSKRSILPPLQASPEAIQLDIFFLERPAEDPLLSTVVWKEVDQVGVLTTDNRDSLQENGFRIGRVSSNPPPSIQRLLGLVADIPHDSPEYTKPQMGRHQFLLPGAEAEIATGIERDQCEFLLKGKGEAKTLEYERVGCVLRMKAHRLQDGWVRVDFQPEIHHGDRRLRHDAAHANWAYRAGQDIDKLLDHRFSATMNVGEMIMITSTTGNDASLGDRFFCQEAGGANSQLNHKLQKVLFVRVVNTGQPPTLAAK